MATTDVQRSAAEALLAMGIGRPIVLAGADPAAGAECEVDVGQGLMVVFRTFVVTAVYSAAAGTRRPRLVIDDGTTVLYETAIGSGIAPNFTRDVVWAASMGSGVSAGFTVVECWGHPPAVLYPGYRVRTVTTGLDVGDDYGPPRVYGLALPLGRDWQGG